MTPPEQCYVVTEGIKDFLFYSTSLSNSNLLYKDYANAMFLSNHLSAIVDHKAKERHHFQHADYIYSKITFMSCDTYKKNLKFLVSTAASNSSCRHPSIKSTDMHANGLLLMKLRNIGRYLKSIPGPELDLYESNKENFETIEASLSRFMSELDVTEDGINENIQKAKDIAELCKNSPDDFKSYQMLNRQYDSLCFLLAGMCDSSFKSLFADIDLFRDIDIIKDAIKQLGDIKYRYCYIQAEAALQDSDINCNGELTPALSELPEFHLEPYMLYMAGAKGAGNAYDEYYFNRMFRYFENNRDNLGDSINYCCKYLSEDVFRSSPMPFYNLGINCLSLEQKAKVEFENVKKLFSEGYSKPAFAQERLRVKSLKNLSVNLSSAIHEFLAKESELNPAEKKILENNHVLIRKYVDSFAKIQNTINDVVKIHDNLKDERIYVSTDLSV